MGGIHVKRVIASLSVVAAIGFPVTSVFSEYKPLHQAIVDLQQTAQGKVLAAARTLVNAEPRRDRSANDLAWECLAAIQLSNLGYEDSKVRLGVLADSMLRLVVRSRRTGKAIGWPSAAKHTPCMPAKEDSKVPAPCEGSDTVFAFQSGLGIACLSRAGLVLHRSELLDTAKEAMTYWDRLRMSGAPCKECIYFAISDSPTDKDRYVRNVNLFMAYGARELGHATGNVELLSLANKAINSDVWERDHGNRGYLGQLDRLWISRPDEADRIENHSASVALLLNTMAHTMKDTAIDQHALTVWRDWATCVNSRCQTKGCKYWAGNPSQCQATATAAHCAFRLRNDLAQSKCKEFLTRVSKINAYGLWAILQAQS
jgi:hypothetical protein